MAAPSVEAALEARRHERGNMSSSREVYSDGEWVYKFDMSEDEEGWKPQEQNRVEWEVYMYLTMHPEVLPPSTAIPEMVLLETDDSTVVGGCILASRYVEVINTIPDCEYWDGLCECLGTRPTCWWEMVDKDGPHINDLCGNVFHDKHNVYWLLDLGYGSAEVGHGE